MREMELLMSVWRIIRIARGRSWCSLPTLISAVGFVQSGHTTTLTRQINYDRQKGRIYDESSKSTPTNFSVLNQISFDSDPDSVHYRVGTDPGPSASFRAASSSGGVHAGLFRGALIDQRPERNRCARG